MTPHRIIVNNAHNFHVFNFRISHAVRKYFNSRFTVLSLFNALGYVYTDHNEALKWKTLSAVTTCWLNLHAMAVKVVRSMLATPDEIKPSSASTSLNWSNHKNAHCAQLRKMQCAAIPRVPGQLAHNMIY